jgi:hypothetical protein
MIPALSTNISNTNIQKFYTALYTALCDVLITGD